MSGGDVAWTFAMEDDNSALPAFEECQDSPEAATASAQAYMASLRGQGLPVGRMYLVQARRTVRFMPVREIEPKDETGVPVPSPELDLKVDLPSMGRVVGTRQMRAHRPIVARSHTLVLCAIHDGVHEANSECQTATPAPSGEGLAGSTVDREGNEPVTAHPGSDRLCRRCGHAQRACKCVLAEVREVSWAEAVRVSTDALLNAEARRDALAEREAAEVREDPDAN